MEFEILPMTEKHINGVEALENECFSKPWSRADIAAQLTNPAARFLVAEAAGDVAGYIGIYEVFESCEVANLAVTEKYRRRGLASALIQKASADAIKRGCEFITLEVRESNLAARSLYEKLGFSVEGRRKNFYTSPAEDGIIMTKHFNNPA